MATLDTSAAARGKLASTVATTPIGSRELAVKKGAWANIPPKCNRNKPICFSPYLYGPAISSNALQQDQTVPSGRNALRQARRQLPRIRPACVDPAMAPR